MAQGKTTKVTRATPAPRSKTPTGTKPLITNKLDNLQQERLVILMEEASEVIKDACKTLRFGFDDKNPLLEGAITNREHLEREIGDFNNAVRMLVAAGDIKASRIKIAAEIKREMISYWSNQPKSVL